MMPKLELYRYGFTLWNTRHTRSFGMQYCRPWERWQLALWNNGGRLPDECFDLSCNVGKIAISFTLWGIGDRWATVLRYLPDNNRMSYWAKYRSLSNVRQFDHNE